MLDMGHSDRDAVLIFYAWTAVIGLAVLLMYVAGREDWYGSYWIGVVFGVVGAAACLAVTLMPSRRITAARPSRESASKPPRASAPNLEEAR
jgi:UDP-GlcNAc:undecaprenyl-phosphate GlcNAc-1-phosphate transferase